MEVTAKGFAPTPRVAPFGKRIVYVNNFSHVPKTPAGMKHLIDMVRQEFAAAEYNHGLAGECFLTEEAARRSLKGPNDCYFVLEVPVEAISDAN